MLCGMKCLEGDTAPMISKCFKSGWLVHADTSHEYHPAGVATPLNEQMRDVQTVQIHSTSPRLRLNGHCDVQQMHSFLRVNS